MECEILHFSTPLVFIDLNVVIDHRGRGRN